MAMSIRRAEQRGRTKLDWLESYHVFSFANFHDLSAMGFKGLRVINDDIVAPASGFHTHPHQDMEIITYILEGSLAHKDSMGNGTNITKGEVQVMSAGTGVQHSEFNPSPADKVRLLQMWVYPQAKGLAPRYDQTEVDSKMQVNEFFTVIAPEGAPIQIQQDAKLAIAPVALGGSASYTIEAGRAVWCYVAEGMVVVQGGKPMTLKKGDSIAIENESKFAVMANSESKLVLFDLKQ